MQKITQFLIVLLVFSASAQDYRSGYYIDNEGAKIEGFIKYSKSTNSPDVIYFKNTSDSEAEAIKTYLISSFGIKDSYTYENFLVDADLSSNRVREIGKKRDPKLEKKRLLLRYIVDGKADLLLYEKSGIKKYFYRIDNGSIYQLLYKKYLENGNVKENEYYKQQIYNSFKDCPQVRQNEVDKLEYTESQLIKFIELYNACNGATNSIVSVSEIKPKFNLNIGAGISLFSANLFTSLSNDLNVDYGTTVLPRFSAELELVFPSGGNHIAIFLGLLKNGNLKETKTIPLPSTLTPEQDVTFTYEGIEIPLGLRYYIPINSLFKLSLHAGFSMEFISNTGLDYEISMDVRESNEVAGHFFTGLGLHYGKFNLETRINLNQKSIKARAPTYDQSEIGNIGIVLSYNLL